MEFLSIHSIALWTLMFSLSRGQHLCAVAVTADREKVAFLGGCFIQNPRFWTNGSRNRPNTLFLAGKRNERRLKMQPFADPTAQKRNLSLAIEIAAHFLRNERHYLVDVLGKPSWKACLTTFHRTIWWMFRGISLSSLDTVSSARLRRQPRPSPWSACRTPA